MASSPRSSTSRSAVPTEPRSSRAVALGGVMVLLGVTLAVVGAANLGNSSEGEPLVAPIDVPEYTAMPAPVPEPDVDVQDLPGRAADLTPPPPEDAEGRLWTVTMETTVGRIVLELDGAAAPQAVASFRALSEDGYFDGTSCHRLTTSGIFVLQCGDPTATGMGGPAYRFGPVENAPADNLYPAGTLAMARVGNDGYSNGSQFFVVYEDSTIPSDSAGGYTVFGTVVEGIDIVVEVAQVGTATGSPDGYPAIDVTLLEVSIQ